jgi:hypothetical protein
MAKIVDDDLRQGFCHHLGSKRGEIGHRSNGPSQNQERLAKIYDIVTQNGLHGVRRFLR